MVMCAAVDGVQGSSILSLIKFSGVDSLSVKHVAHNYIEVGSIPSQPIFIWVKSTKG